MNEEGLSRPSWYDVVSLYIRIIIAGNSGNPQNLLVIAGICEFLGFLVKLVSGNCAESPRGVFVYFGVRAAAFLKELGIYARLVVYRNRPKLTLRVRTKRVYLDPLGRM